VKVHDGFNAFRIFPEKRQAREIISPGTPGASHEASIRLESDSLLRVKWAGDFGRSSHFRQLDRRASMKIKLAALLALLVLGLAGCGDGAGGNANNSNATRNSSNTTNATSSTTTTKDEGMVKANANPTDKTGGTSEGCKCSAAGMACDGKDGGCCGKEGCSTMKDGKSSCCSKEGNSEMACCSTAGKSAGKEGGKGMPGGSPEKKPETAPAKKS
jgi:hypothetical protein